MKLLIKFPTRGRRDKFYKVLDLYYDMLEDIDNTEFCITMDEDDPIMNNNAVFNRLDTYDNLSYYVGYSKSKIEAINADLEEFNDIDIILLASDDMIPQIKGYDNIIRENMKKYYPDTDGVLWFFDGNRKDLNTLCILGKKYYDRFSYIYHPAYKSFYSDNEFMLVANKLKKQTFIDQIIIRHEHPDIPQYRNNMDEMYMKERKNYPHDFQIYEMRRKNNFGLK